jgi:hypothetical protein
MGQPAKKRQPAARALSATILFPQLSLGSILGDSPIKKQQEGQQGRSFIQGKLF